MKKIISILIVWFIVILSIPHVQIQGEGNLISDDLKRVIEIEVGISEEEELEEKDYIEYAKEVVAIYSIDEDMDSYAVMNYKGIEYFENLEFLILYIDAFGNKKIENLDKFSDSLTEQPEIIVELTHLDKDNKITYFSEYVDNYGIEYNQKKTIKKNVIEHLHNLSEQYKGSENIFLLDVMFLPIINELNWMNGISSNVDFRMFSELYPRNINVPFTKQTVDGESYFEAIINLKDDNVVFKDMDIFRFAKADEQVSGVILHELNCYLQKLTGIEKADFLLEVDLEGEEIVSADRDYFEKHTTHSDERDRLFFPEQSEYKPGKINSITLKIDANDEVEEKLIEFGKQIKELEKTRITSTSDLLQAELYFNEFGLRINNYVLQDDNKPQLDFNILESVYRFYYDNTYSVNFETNGGNLINSLENVFEDSLIEKPSNPIKEGYDFIAWYSDKDLKNKWNFETDKVMSDVTLYAKWEKIQEPEIIAKYTVSFETNGGSQIESITDVESESTIESPKNPNKEGYDFVAWYSDKDLKNKWNFETDKVMTDVTLYAKWEKIQEPEIIAKYTVSFETNGGSQIESITNVESESTIESPKNPNKEGYDFVAWYSDKDLKNKWNFETDKIMSDMTLYAKWTKKIIDNNLIGDLGDKDPLNPNLPSTGMESNMKYSVSIIISGLILIAFKKNE